MPVRRPLFVAASLAALLLTAACAGGGNNAGPLAPAPVSVSTNALAPLTVQVDRVCDGQETSIRVSIDGKAIGTTNPGEAGVETMVTIGEHKVSAISQRGTMWGPYPTLVTPAGQVERLGCMPPPQPPDTI